MDRIVDYKLLHAAIAEELTAQVTNDLADNWQPFGPPVANAGTQLVQAMVRTESSTPSAAGRAAEQLLAGNSEASMDSGDTQVMEHGRSLTGRQR